MRRSKSPVDFITVLAIVEEEGAEAMYWLKLLRGTGKAIAVPNPKLQRTPAMETIPPHEKHRWLMKFVGEWRSECKMSMGDGTPEITLVGAETVRAIGEYFIVGEGTGDMPGTDQKATMILTVGYDPVRDRFPGTWISSMMHTHWVYDGEFDAAGRVLTLHADGPRCDAPAETAKYRDIHTFIDDNHRVMTGNMLGPDGQWSQLMEVHYYRK